MAKKTEKKVYSATIEVAENGFIVNFDRDREYKHEVYITLEEALNRVEELLSK